ncbi:MAG: helix-turn-helix transcriptional regulator [Planctomycetaceae bacterium]
MQFGDRVRELREQFGITQKELAQRLNVSASYVNKVEKGRLHFGDYPSAKFIHKIAAELDADEDELLLLADKVPEAILRRIQERPEAFRRIAEMDEKELDRFLEQYGTRG